MAEPSGENLPVRPMFVLWLGWACVFAAYSALENLQSSLHTSSGLGVFSITIVYLCKAISSSQVRVTLQSN